MTDAERSFSSSDAIRASSIACSFLASSYSEFSEMSPNSRASLMRSATSRRLIVERCSISSLSFSSPSGVSRTSFCMLVVLGRVRRKEKPAQMRTSRCAQWCGAARHGSTGSSASSGDRGPQPGDQRALLRERLGALERVLDGRRPAEALDVPRVELAQVARRALRSEVLLRAVDDPGPLLEHLVARAGRRRGRPGPARTATGSRATPRASMTAARPCARTPSGRARPRPCRRRRSPARAAPGRARRRGRSPGGPCGGPDRARVERDAGHARLLDQPAGERRTALGAQLDGHGQARCPRRRRARPRPPCRGP